MRHNFGADQRRQLPQLADDDLAFSIDYADIFAHCQNALGLLDYGLRDYGGDYGDARFFP